MTTGFSRSGKAFIASLLVSFLGCSAPPSSDALDETVTESPLLLSGQDMLWKSNEVAYCFISPSGASSAIWEVRKREFREAMAQSWGADNVVRFTERACDSGTFRVSFATLGQGVAAQAGVGRHAALQLGMQISPTYLRDSNPRDFKWVVAHEMGHILGFLHEQDQPNSTCNYGRDSSGRGISLTGYDPNSVMNYCANRTNTAILSALDKQGLKRVYSGTGPAQPPSGTTPTPPPPSPPSGGTSEICEPQSDISPGLDPSQGGSGTAFSFKLTNRCPNALRVAWLDYQGREVSYGALASGAEVTFKTYGGHHFRLRSATTNRFIVDLAIPNGNSALTMPYR